MDLIELKKMILNNQPLKRTIIFKYEKDTFLINQYIENIRNISNSNLIYLDSLNELKGIDLLSNDNSLYIYKTDKLNDFISNKPLIIVCNSISKDLINDVNLFVVEFPDLENWQLKDYIQVNLPKLKEENISLLGNLSKWDPYRIDNNIKIISLFGEGASNNIFLSMVRDGFFSDSSQFTIFDLSNSILKKDISKINLILKDISNINPDPLALTTILEKNFINILNIQTNPRIAPEELNLNYKQFLAIKYNCGVYSDIQLLKIIKLLSQIDYKLKSGLLEYDKIIDYLIINILGV